MLWLARDYFGKDTRCFLYGNEPNKGKDGVWRTSGAYLEIFPFQMPVKLKPGEGPVQVKLVVEE